MIGLRLLAVAAALLAVPAAAKAAAGDIPFTGGVTSSCLIAVQSGGNLGVSSNLRILASGQPGGTLGLATLTAVGTGFTVSVDQPAGFDSAPGDDTAPTTFLARYRTTGATSVPGLTTAPNAVNPGITTVRVHLRASKSGQNTFAAGDYTATVVLRCE